jgi:hypothetical protein
MLRKAPKLATVKAMPTRCLFETQSRVDGFQVSMFDTDGWIGEIVISDLEKQWGDVGLPNLTRPRCKGGQSGDEE